MTPLLKVLLTLALLLPIGAFVVGSLIGAEDDEPDPRPALEITDAPPTTQQAERPSPSPVRPRPGSAEDDDRDDRDDRDNRSEGNLRDDRSDRGDGGEDNGEEGDGEEDDGGEDDDDGEGDGDGED